MKKLYILTILLFATGFAFSQQEMQVSHNMFNHLDVNPGYAGLKEAICATAIARDQWVGFKDADGNTVNPRTYLFSMDAHVRRNWGAGITLLQDQLGFEKNLAVKLSLSRHINIRNGKLGVGVQAAFLNKRIDFTKFKPQQAGDQLLNGGTSKEGNMLADVAVGAFYDNPRSFYSGVSVSQSFRRKYTFPNAEAAPSLVPHWYFTGGGYIQLTRVYELIPSVFIKTDLAAVQMDINALLKMNDRYWGGLSWRQTDALAIIIGGNVYKGLEASYAYDITTSAVGTNGRSGGSHEIMLHYCFKIVKPEKGRHMNVRFLAPLIAK